MSTQPDFDTMNDAELADYHYTHRDNPLGDDADLEEIEVEIALSVRNEPNATAQPRDAVRAADVGFQQDGQAGVSQVNP